jgi:hypothetical protein
MNQMKNSTIDKFSFVGETATSDFDNDDFTKIATIDLRGQNAIAEVTSAAKEFSVIAIEAEDRLSAIAALIAGADAVTFSAITPLEMDLVRKAVAKGYRIVDEKQTATPHFLVFPQIKIAAKIKELQFRIAMEIFNYWRGEPFVRIPQLEQLGLGNLILSLKQKSGISLEEELARIVESLKHKQMERRDLLVHIEMVLENWFFSERAFILEDDTPNCCLAVLKANASQIMGAILTSLKKFSELENRSGSYTRIQWLLKTIASLRNIEVKYEREYQLEERKIHLSSQAYQRLQQKLNLEDRYLTESLNSLNFRYQKIIHARTLLIASQIISSLIYLLIEDKNKILATDTLLYQLQEQLARQLENYHNLTDSSVLDYSKIELFEISQYRDRLTMKLGKPFNEWGFLSEDKQEILLKEVVRRSLRIAWEMII